MFNTQTGNMVIDGIPGEVKKALKQAKPFDALLGACLSRALEPRSTHSARMAFA